MKHIKKKIKDYEKMLEEDAISEPIADQVIMDLDSMIAELESVILDNLNNIEPDDIG